MLVLVLVLVLAGVGVPVVGRIEVDVDVGVDVGVEVAVGVVVVFGDGIAGVGHGVRVGVTVGATVTVGFTVAVGEAVAVAAAVAVAVGIAVRVAVGTGTAVDVGIAVAVLTGAGISVAIATGGRVGTRLGLGSAVGGTGTDVRVGATLGTLVGAMVGALVGGAGAAVETATGALVGALAGTAVAAAEVAGAGLGAGVGVGAGGAGRLAAGARAGAAAGAAGAATGATATTGTGGGDMSTVGAADGRAAGDAAATAPLARGDARGLGDGRAAAAACCAGLTFALTTAVGATVGTSVGAGVALIRSITARATGGPAATPVTAVATTTVVPTSTNPIGPLRNAASTNGLIVRSFLVAMIGLTRSPAQADRTDRPTRSARALAIPLLRARERAYSRVTSILVEHAELLDLAYDAILVWELKTGAINFWNRGSEELYGWGKTEVLGRTPQAILQTQFPVPLAEINAELVRTQRWEGELVHTRRDGTTVVVNSRWALHFDKDGVPFSVLAINRDVTERKRAEAALAHQASHDGLTQLPNRLLLQERLERGVAAARNGAERLALLLLDLDRFKEVNDRFGHHAGDELLRQVALRLVGTLQPADLVARLGGDEFAVLLEHAPTEEAICVAEKLLQILKAPLVIDGHTVVIGASIGITTWEPPDTDASTLLRQADVAMYVAKRSGRGYAVYAPEQDQHSRDRLARVAELRQAITGGELHVHFQPIASLDARAIAHVEALARWDHPTRGLLVASEFVPLAEQTGVVVALDRWVLGAALEQCRAWRDAGRSIPVAVNLSAHSLHDPDLPDRVAAELARTGVPAQSLLLELTETTVMVDPQRAARTLNCLRDQGIRVAIDDFGMGNAGFNYLRDLPADQLKIDRSFVRNMVSNPADAAIVRAMVALAHGLGLQVVAEGVEDSAIWNDLQTMGCDLAQGAYFCLPMPAAEILRLIASGHLACGGVTSQAA